MSHKTHEHDHPGGRDIDTSHIDNPDVKHERDDVPIKPVFMFLLYLAVAAVAIHILIYLLFQYFEKSEKASEPPRSPLANERQVIPNEPRLQLAPSKSGETRPNLLKEHPLEELKIMKAQEEDALSHYGWVDQNAGVVRIPIDRAKQMLLERGGLPSRPQVPLKPVMPDEAVPSDSSGGTLPERGAKQN
jgi:hypothetical protein